MASKIQNNRFASIDALKGLSIIFVIVLHVDPVRIFYLKFFFNATINQAVQIFFFIIGFLSANYYQKSLPVKKYYWNKYVRIFVPLYIVGLISAVLHFYIFGENIVSVLPYWFFGYMKDFSWGGYFLTCYIEWVLFFPIIYYAIKNNLIVPMTVGFFVLHFFFYLNKGFVLDVTNSDIWFFKSIVITYLPHISLGLLYGSLILRNELNTAVKNFIFICSLLMVVFLYNNNFIASRSGWGDLSLFNFQGIMHLDLAILYSFFLCVVLVSFFETFPKIVNLPLSFLGKLSYEIFLVQAVFFQLVYKTNSILFLGDLRGVLLSLLSIISISIILKKVHREYLPKFIRCFGVFSCQKKIVGGSS